MAKLITMFFVLIVIQFCMVLYAQNDYSAQNSTQLWAFVMNWNIWTTALLIVTIGTIASGIGTTGINAGSVFGFKTDFLILAPAVAGLISIGAVFTDLANIVSNELISRIFYTTCSIDLPLSCRPVVLILAVTIMPWALYYVWTVMEYWRGKDY